MGITQSLSVDFHCASENGILVNGSAWIDFNVKKKMIIGYGLKDLGHSLC